MKISELIALLEQRQKRYGDIEADFACENEICSISSDSVWLGRDGVLYIDADDNYYKESMAIDPHEGECTQSIKA
jgi:hypothetical protein